MNNENEYLTETDYAYMPYQNDVGDSGDYIFDLIVYL